MASRDERPLYTSSRYIRAVREENKAPFNPKASTRGCKNAGIMSEILLRKSLIRPPGLKGIGTSWPGADWRMAYR